MSKSPKELKSTRKPKANEIGDRAKLIRLLRLARWWVARLGDDLPFPLWNDWRISEAGNELAAAVGVRSLLTMSVAPTYCDESDREVWEFRIAVWQSLSGSPLDVGWDVKGGTGLYLRGDGTGHLEFRHIDVEPDEWRAFRASAANALRIFAINEIKERLADTSGAAGSRGEKEHPQPTERQEEILRILYAAENQGERLTGKEIVAKLAESHLAIDDLKNLSRHTTPLRKAGLITEKQFRLTNKGIAWVKQNSKRLRSGLSRRT